MAGPHVFDGYHRDPDATAEVMSGRWLRSGDLGAIDEDGFLTITGRKKDLIITSSGKNISPTNIENALRESRWISQAVVHGDNRSYLVALLTLDADEVGALAEELGVAGDMRACGPAVDVQRDDTACSLTQQLSGMCSGHNQRPGQDACASGDGAAGAPGVPVGGKCNPGWATRSATRTAPSGPLAYSWSLSR